MPEPSPDDHVRRVVREANHFLVSYRIAFKQMDKEMPRKMFTTYVRATVEYRSSLTGGNILAY